MTIPSYIIVFIWLLPVATHVLLPLAMLVIWLAYRPIHQLFFKTTGDTAPIAMEAAKG